MIVMTVWTTAEKVEPCWRCRRWVPVEQYLPDWDTCFTCVEEGLRAPVKARAEGLRQALLRGAAR